MQHIISVTSQGQISIPVKMRRLLNLDSTKKVYVTYKSGKIIIEPITDFLSLKGVLHSQALKNKTSKEIELIEKNAIKEARLEKYLNKLKK